MRDELDTILDEAIQSYSAAEPSPDLAGRILRQAQTQGRSPGRRWKLALVFALPIAAAVALGIVLLGQWTLPKPPVSIASASSTPSLVHPQPAKTIAAATHVPLQAHRRVRKTASRSSWARPLPVSYSKEELALLNFVQQHPKEAAEIAEAQKKEIADALKPITIPPIQIKPLSIAALN